MKNVLSAFAVRVTLLFAALAVVSAHTATAQPRLRGGPRPVVMMSPFVVTADPIAQPKLATERATAPAALPSFEGSITLPDGTVHVLSRPNSDGSVVLPDGTVAERAHVEGSPAKSTASGA
jgi:hypothetical protein